MGIENHAAGHEFGAHQPTRPQLAGAFGISSRWIGELRAQGILPADGATLAENIAAWVQYQIGRAGND